MYDVQRASWKVLNPDQDAVRFGRLPWACRVSPLTGPLAAHCRDTGHHGLLLLAVLCALPLRSARGSGAIPYSLFSDPEEKLGGESLTTHWSVLLSLGVGDVAGVRLL